MSSKSSKKNQLTWINWSIKSQDVLFKTTIKGVGDGEQKVASELDTNVLGQNSDFDMKITMKGIQYECDVKKLDNYTFTPFLISNADFHDIKKKKICKNLISIRLETDMKF